jgi:hypothetical protein
VQVVARGRDLRTGADHAVETIADVRLDVEVDFANATIISVRSDPRDEALGRLAGTAAYPGFRRAVTEAAPDDAATHSVRHQLLDDLPLAVMLSGRVLRLAGIGLGKPGRALPVDICAGWADGGTLVQGFTDQGPPLRAGPLAGDVDAGRDLLAWHVHDVLPPRSTRRRRRLDVWREDGIGQVDCFLRDTHVDEGALETVVHEYAVGATIDLESRIVLTCEALPGPLPYPECPGAAASAARIEGDVVDGLRTSVAERLIGPTTCTHLNDSLRALADAGALLDVLEGTR